MTTRWTLALAALLLTGCGDSAVSGVPTGERDRALALAEEIVTAMAKYYAERYHDGTMRAFAVDPGRLGLANDPNTPDLGYISAPALEGALRTVAEQFPSDRASWLISIDPVERLEIGPDVHYFLGAEVVDYHASHCCPRVAAELAKDDDGWVLLGVARGGYATETDESRRERLAWGAEVTPMTARGRLGCLVVAVLASLGSAPAISAQRWTNSYIDA